MSNGDSNLNSTQFGDFESAVDTHDASTTESGAHGFQTDWERLVAWLPCLGAVLWLYRTACDDVFPRARLTPLGALLFDHPALAAFADCAAVSVHSEVRSQGPREWLEFRDMRGNTIAKLYLLPDTDYLAWDSMIEDCHLHQQPVREKRSRYANLTCACVSLAIMRGMCSGRIVRFRMLRLPCLQLLGLRQLEHVSPLGQQTATMIANEDRATADDASMKTDS